MFKPINSFTLANLVGKNLDIKMWECEKGKIVFAIDTKTKELFVLNAISKEEN